MSPNDQHRRDSLRRGINLLLKAIDILSEIKGVGKYQRADLDAVYERLLIAAECCSAAVAGGDLVPGALKRIKEYRNGI